MHLQQKTTKRPHFMAKHLEWGTSSSSPLFAFTIYQYIMLKFDHNSGGTSEPSAVFLFLYKFTFIEIGNDTCYEIQHNKRWKTH